MLAARVNVNVAAALAIRRSGGHLGLGRRLVAPPFRRSSPLKVDPRASGRRASRCASTVLYVSRSLLYYNYKESREETSLAFGYYICSQLLILLAG